MLPKLSEVKESLGKTRDKVSTEAIIMAVSMFQSMGMDSHAKAAMTPFSMDSRAQMSGGAGRATNLVVALVVGGLMAAFLLPIAIDEIAGVDTSSWDDGAASLWEILPVIIVLAIFLFFVGRALQSS